MVVKNGFGNITEKPFSIQFKINNIENPSIPIITSTFAIQTNSYDGYMLDQLSQGLTINFICGMPCQTCQTGSNTKC